MFLALLFLKVDRLGCQRSGVGLGIHVTSVESNNDQTKCAFQHIQGCNSINL